MGGVVKFTLTDRVMFLIWTMTAIPAAWYLYSHVIENEAVGRTVVGLTNQIYGMAFLLVFQAWTATRRKTL